jgi:hypothetical protein
MVRRKNGILLPDGPMRNRTGSPWFLGKCLLLLATVALTACAQQAFDMQQGSQQLQTPVKPTRLQQANSNIGKNFWLTARIQFCRRPFRTKSECHGKDGGKVTVMSVTDQTTLLSAILPGDERPVYYFISHNSETGYVESLEFESNTTSIDPAPKIEAEAAAEIRNARGTFVLVVTVPGGAARAGSDTPDKRPYIDGTCTMSNGRAARTEKVSTYVPGAWPFDADSVSCTLRGVTYGVGTMSVELHRGSAKGEMVARSHIERSTDFVSVAGY